MPDTLLYLSKICNIHYKNDLCYRSFRPALIYISLSLGSMRQLSLFRKKKIFIRKLRIIQLVLRYVLKVLIFERPLDNFSYWCNYILMTRFMDIYVFLKIMLYGPLFLAKMEYANCSAPLLLIKTKTCRQNIKSNYPWTLKSKEQEDYGGEQAFGEATSTGVGCRVFPCFFLWH